MPLSAFHPVVQAWFRERLGEPTQPQREGWPLIRAGHHTLIAAPTGAGKTLAAFLITLDQLLRAGADLPDQTLAVYVSPLRALSNDVQKNLQAPLDELRMRDVFLPEVRVLVRTGDTPASERARMVRKPPHILVTTPESLYILLTSQGGRNMLRSVRTVIVDEIHALARDKRGSHLALSLERLEALSGPFQRIGLSATQKPLRDVARFLGGVGREVKLVNAGHRRRMDVSVEVPPSPLEHVCSHEQWEEIYSRVAELIGEHRTALVFVNTRKMAERVAARLTEALGEQQVTCHHSSLSRERRHDAEQRLKAGKLRALVATASLELGIDIGEIDLVIQIGATRSIATFLQRVGRAGHTVHRVPKGRLFPLTLDELVEAAALLRAAARGELDRTPQPAAPLDILTQQIVAECVGQEWSEVELFERFRKAWPYRELSWEEYQSAIRLQSEGRHGLLHRDGVSGRLMARKRARITAVTSGGAIPDVADFHVLAAPDDTFVGTLNEDFAVESNKGDIFQLGNTSWRVLKVEAGVVRVADAQGQPATAPFWLGEGASRTVELSTEIGTVRELFSRPSHAVRSEFMEYGLPESAVAQLEEYIVEGVRGLGAVPMQRRVVIERFFDESGGMQMVLHAPFGGRINRAWGLALRKRFCRGFGFELQAAANEEAIVISLGLQHSFPLDEVFNYLHPKTARKTLTQAILDQPMFESRWRWNAMRSLVLERMQKGKKVPPAILRMRAGDLLAAAFPAAVACPENLPAGDLPVPMEHPLVRQTIEDCFHEAMDIDGFIDVMERLRDKRIERVAIDTTEPSAFARGILTAAPYSFLDDAPLEERRTQAVMARRTLDAQRMDTLGALDPDAVERVREEAWPQPASLEETHEALLWMGFVTPAEAERAGWTAWLAQLAAGGRASLEAGRWLATEATRDPKEMLRGRLEALGPVFEDAPWLATFGEPSEVAALLREVEREGGVLRTRLEGKTAFCERRLLARIHRYTLDRLRREIEPVSASVFLQFLACWQSVDEECRLEGPVGVAEVARRLAGFEMPAAEWENALRARVRSYRREWLDDLTLAGELAWGRLWGGAATPIRSTPIALTPRDELSDWLTLARKPQPHLTSGPAQDILAVLRARGAMFPQELQREARLLDTHFEMGLAELVSHGLATCDSFAALRQMLTPPSKRRRLLRPVGRWSLFRSEAVELSAEEEQRLAELVARRLLQRTGVVFRKTVTREKAPIPWGELARVYRRMELRGEVRGGRFVGGFAGEQFALPEAVERLRAVRKRAARPAPDVAACDPLNFQGILTPDARVSSTSRRKVRVG